MLTTILVLIFFLSFLFIFFYQEYRYDSFKVNDKNFQIEKYENHQQKIKIQSLNTLVNIRQRLDTLVTHLLKKYPKNKFMHRLQSRFKNTTLREANPNPYSTDTSYTINKGDTMVLCLRTTDQKVVDLNTLTYVAVHELAHIFSSSFHHNLEFWRNMKFLVDEAIECGIYRETNYSQNPVRYCGIQIASNIPSRIGTISKDVLVGGGSLQHDIVSFLLSRSTMII